MAKKTEVPLTREYVALVLLTSPSGGEKWTPGSMIALTDEQAKTHLAAGNVAPLDHTDPPALDVGPAVIVHAPAEVAP